MSRIKVESKASFQAGLTRRLKVKCDDPILHFSRHFFADYSLADLNQRDWTALVQTLLSSWKFYKKFDAKKPAVRVVAGRTGYLVIEVVSVEMPFLLESIRIELNRLGLVLADVQQCLLSVLREGKKILFTDQITPNENHIRLEIESVGAPQGLIENIRDVLELVGLVVNDFSSMRRQLLLWSDPSQFERGVDEVIDLLKWFYANNFTFLGYEEYKPVKSGRLKLMSSSRLGLCCSDKQAEVLPISVSPITFPDGTIRLEKLAVRSKVHRPAYMDSLTICQREGDKPLRLCRFIGLFTANVYHQNPAEIPVVRQKIADIFAANEIVSSSHKGREVSRIIENLPREELFFAPVNDLQCWVNKIFALQERRIVRLLARQDQHFANCIVYVPKDIHTTTLRRGIEAILIKAFDGSDVEFTTHFSESALTRTHFTLRIAASSEVEFGAIEYQISQLARSWIDEFQQILYSRFELDEAVRLFKIYREVFSSGYQADYSVETAREDIFYIEQLSLEAPLALSLYGIEGCEKTEIRFRLFHHGSVLPLSDVVPILENMGARTVEEYPYELCRGGQEIWLHDFLLEFGSLPKQALGSFKLNFEEAFKQIWCGDKENDAFNRLISKLGIDHRQVMLIRSYARYLGQLQNANSQQFIADCLAHYAHITEHLLNLFECRFKPTLSKTKRNIQQLEQKIYALIADDVINLADDRVLRSFVELITATLRTNYYQTVSVSDAVTKRYKSYISFKFQAKKISLMPNPKPEFEIFVYANKVEGVHLRGGKIARGGIRWSDRTEDYRTEVLGLVKAQQVKNSVIVPVGAKGGFLAKQVPESATQAQRLAEGVSCYEIFIQGLLDITDNLIKARVVKPQQVVCYDDDDYYLVVAADKGTATFSDIANAIAVKNGFWLGDAFASGGSIGYDHKAMGITARGAWISVQQHFRDLGKDIQKNQFTVVGIGDMSGDVFGNGMLLSQHICLVGAFNHMHIFVDPEPSAEQSYVERQRLFNLPQSSWADYSESLLSRGGGIFSRSIKAIPISRQMKSRFDIKESTLTPDQLIVALLKARVDLLWNGGIGTYIKSHQETHQAVADKANDFIRIDGRELGCKVVGEGGNLGLTQLARVEFCLQGGKCFSDFIDNAGGVTCSDAEVNIKIVLNQLVEDRSLTERLRQKLLKSMTAEVAAIVLESNYRQARAINLMSHQAKKRGVEYSELLRVLEEQGNLDRQLEFLPTDEEINERKVGGKALTAPELSLLSSYVKGGLKKNLAESTMLDEAYFSKELFAAFPKTLVNRYPKELQSHRLARELVATVVANDLVNYMGMTFVSRLQESTGEKVDKIARAYLVARDVFRLPERWAEVSALDYLINPVVQKQMLFDLIRLIRRVTRWLLRNRRRTQDLDGEIAGFRDSCELLLGQWESLLAGAELSHWQEKGAYFKSTGVPNKLAGFMSATHQLYSVMGIVEASIRTKCEVERIARLYFTLGDRLKLSWFSQNIHEYQANNQWQALARETLQDDLNWQQVALTVGLVAEFGKDKPINYVVDQWIAKHNTQVSRWMKLQAEMSASAVLDPAVFTVGIRELLDLAQSSCAADNRF
ncbi:MAG: NAD-glutamate dehydrogenase [Pseudomonadales bacterium]|nr:NAD-glutamate dehydrogenase [Pseudomonadales bacterium]